MGNNSNWQRVNFEEQLLHAKYNVQVYKCTSVQQVAKCTSVQCTSTHVYCPYHAKCTVHAKCSGHHLSFSPSVSVSYLDLRLYLIP